MNIKQQADSYVEMFKQYAGGWANSYPKKLYSTHCAIIHIEGLLNFANKYAEKPIRFNFLQILTELKSRI